MAGAEAPVAVPPLTEEQRRFAAAYLNETDPVREQRVDEIRRWIIGSDQLCARLGDYARGPSASRGGERRWARPPVCLY